jgi:vancomycin permeability regulator SanA
VTQSFDEGGAGDSAAERSIARDGASEESADEESADRESAGQVGADRESAAHGDAAEDGAMDGEDGATDGDAVDRGAAAENRGKSDHNDRHGQPHRRLRRAYQLLCVATVLFFLPVTFVRLSGDQYVRSVATVPAEPVGIVFGAAVYGDTPSTYLASRLDVSLALWRAHKIKVFLVSGDNSKPDYNEPKAMRDYLEAHGVPQRLIVLDYAGFDSWETCDRARQVFGVTRAIAISQSFHVPRAVYLCRAAGIETYGVGDGTAGWRLGHDEFVNDAAREILAGASAMYQGIFKPNPTFLGPHETGIAQALQAAFSSDPTYLGPRDSSIAQALRAAGG